MTVLKLLQEPADPITMAPDHGNLTAFKQWASDLNDAYAEKRKAWRRDHPIVPSSHAGPLDDVTAPVSDYLGPLPGEQIVVESDD